MWTEATTEERALAVEALRSGLTTADEALLVRAWGDNRAEVRAVAIDVLARLPGSAFAVLAEATARPLLAMTGRFRPSLEVRPPPAWSEDLARLGVPRKPPQGIGERAWWLRHVIARVDPGRWEAWWSSDPDTLIDRARKSEEAGALLPGWVEAADRYANERWSAAVLGDVEVLRRDDVQARRSVRTVRPCPRRPA